MGTNYYWIGDVCEHCGRGNDRLHIGKSSAGWVFALHVDSEEGINSLDDWRERFAREGSRITNEYGDEVTAEDMLRVITERSREDAPPLDDYWLRQNGASRGPKGLARSRRDRPGDGTWDLVEGCFS